MKHNQLLTLAASLMLGMSSTFAIEIIAHRGASYDAPENTLASFKLGYAQNADADELDIYLSKDGKVVVMHDATPARTGGATHTNKLANMTFEEMRQIDIGKWDKWAGKGFSEKIPALSEVLPLIPEGKKLFIEIKCGPEVLPALAQVLKESGKKPAQTVIIGFDYKTVKAAKEKLPELQVYWLAGKERKTKQYLPVEELITQAKAAKLDGLDLESGFPIDKAFVQKVHAAGLKLYTWTVDDPEVARKEAAAGVDGITTNRPKWLREQLTPAPMSLRIIQSS